MKNKIALILILILLVALYAVFAACGDPLFEWKSK